MKLFEVFDARNDDFLPWSACVFDANMQLMPAFYHHFLQAFGTRITTFEVTEFAPDLNLFAILNMMPNLQQWMIPRLKKKFAHVYAYTPVLEKLLKLKDVRIFLGLNGNFNEAFLEFLMSSAPALSHLELQNLCISADSNLANIAALLQKLPSITLKFKDDEDEDDDDALPVLKSHKLKIKQLSMSSASTSMSGFRQLFLASLDSLETLDLIL